VIVYRATEHDMKTGRTHPWKYAEHNPSWRYVNFRREPDKIESALEDFRPWAQFPATRRFYELIRWLNGADSLFETNDCAFQIRDNCDANQPYKLQADGRLMLFSADLRLSCDPGFAEWLISRLGCYLEQAEPRVHAAAVGLSKASCFFKSASAEGEEVVLYFWAWGDTDDSTMKNLERVFERIHMAAANANEDVRASLNPNGDTGQEHSAPARNSVI
jgi:hypothetical protein